VIHEIPDLPTDAPVISQNADTLFDDPLLAFQVFIQAQSLLISLSDVIGW
jgi:hypothetical protein